MTARQVRLSLGTADDTVALGRALAGLLRAGDLVVLSGELGAGKTTLTTGIGAGLGVRGPVTSPTFVLARVHPSLVGGPDLVHVDAYRLSSPLEVDDLDLDAAVEESVTVVEWGDGKVESLAGSRLEVHLDRGLGHEGEAGAGEEAGGEEKPAQRTVVLRGVGPRWADVDLTAVARDTATGEGSAPPD